MDKLIKRGPRDGRAGGAWAGPVGLSFRAQVSLLVALAVVGMAATLLVLQERTLTRQVIADEKLAVVRAARHVQNRMDLATNAYSSSAVIYELRRQVLDLDDILRADQVVVTDAGGIVLAHSRDLGLIGRQDPELDDKRETISPGGSIVSAPERGANSFDIVVPVFVPGEGRGVMEVETDLAGLQATVAKARREALVPALVALGLVLPLATLLTTRFLGQARAREQRVERRFRSLVQNSSDVILVVDVHGNVVHASPSIERVMGYRAEETIHRNASELIHPDDISAVQARLAELQSGPGASSTLTVRARHSDGSWRWIEATGMNLLDDAAVNGIVVNYRDITTRKRLEDELNHQAFHDSLTGLANRALFSDRIGHALERERRHGEHAAVVFLDLDDFKGVNDSLGHEAGDAVLSAVADRLRDCVRMEDTPARLGGDEFGILLEDINDQQLAVELAQRVLTALEKPVRLLGSEFLVGASVGIACSTGKESTTDLLRNADLAMYVAKYSGKNKIAVYEPGMHERAMRRLELKASLELALENDEFVLHYQPIVGMATGTVVGVEALVRWRHPVQGLVNPDDFIPLAEETDAILALGRWALEVACRQMASWHAQSPGEPPLRLSVNLSAVRLQHGGLAEEISESLQASGLDPRCLVLEITEGSMLDDLDSARERLHELKDLGVLVAIDDFGTGFSSLSYLRDFPIDSLKIDKTYIDPITRSPEDSALARAIVNLGQNLALDVVAEGVEKPEQADVLRRIGCPYAQGFLFARPVEAAELSPYLEARRTTARPVAAPIGS
jgi:diguanylate cyclase (GGDEF)-like protein/PAS domain S-box-containing protein